MRRLRPGRLMTCAIAVLVLVTAALILPLRWIPPISSSFMLIASVAQPAGAGPIDYRWTPWSRISRQATLAMMAGEDQKFLEHHGFDLGSIREAIVESEDGPGRGASTITQQVAKNLFLWPGHSWIRKGIEAWLTISLEILLPKKRILEIYLNVAQFGPTVFGVEAASRAYFHKSAGELNRTEAALLGAVLPNPVRFHVPNPSAYVRARQAWIYLQMAQLDPVVPRRW